MPASTFFEYCRAMEKVEAAEMLYQLKISDFPHLKQDARKSFQRIVERKVRIDDESQYMDFEEFAKKVGLTSG